MKFIAIIEAGWKDTGALNEKHRRRIEATRPDMLLLSLLKEETCSITATSKEGIKNEAVKSSLRIIELFQFEGFS